MNIRRLASGVLWVLLFLTTSAAFATSPRWPDPARSIQVIVPAHASHGAGNVIARAVTDALANELGNRIVLQNFTSNHPHFSGMLGGEESNTEGYTLLLATVDTLVIEPGLQRAPAFVPLDHFAPIGLVAETPHVLLINNSLPVHSVAELTEYLERYPGLVHFGSSGNGSALHLAGESYMNATGTNMVHVPYSTAAPATNNLVSGDIQVMFQTVPDVLNYVRTGRVRALAVMSAERSPALPEVPTMAEAGHPELLAGKWYALLAPRGTPQEVIDHYNAALNTALESPALRQLLENTGTAPLGGSPDMLTRFLTEETARWGRVIDDAHLQQR